MIVISFGAFTAVPDVPVYLYDHALATYGTGLPGSGKSALLARVVVLSDPERRPDDPTLAELPAGTIPEPGAFEGAVWCHNKNTRQVVSELADALRLHRAGWSAGDAFRRIAELCPEPFCGRTYRLLASAEERGADLAGALLDLAEDVRESRRESIKRSATKRRAAMLVPTIAILAPVLILFVAAPLPYLITGWN